MDPTGMMNIQAIHDECEVSDYFQTAASIARRISSLHAGSAVEYLASVQLQELIEQGADLNYNQLVEYANDLVADHDTDDLADVYAEKAKFYQAFENAGLSGHELGDVKIEGDEARYMGLVFQFNSFGNLELQAI
jgi:hypothetical protein